MAGATSGHRRRQSRFRYRGNGSQRFHPVGSEVFGDRFGRNKTGGGTAGRRVGNGRLPATTTLARVNAVVRLSGRFDSERHALCAAGDRAEGAGLRQSEQGITRAGAQAWIALRAWCSRFVLGSRRDRNRGATGRAGRQLGNAVSEPAIPGDHDGAGHAGGAESVRPF